ncbi:hypothetical protein C0214_12260 [Methylobacterium sp. DM1]|nr:hypothetical protein C0214_12260 [Methylobacterium sp. DM1]
MLLAQRLQLCIGVEEVVDVVGRSREGMNSPRIEILLNRLPHEMDRLRDDADGLLILIINGPKETGGAPASRGSVRTKRSRSRIWACPGISARHPRQPGPRLPGEAVEALVTRSEDGSAAFNEERVRCLAQPTTAAVSNDRITAAAALVVLGKADGEVQSHRPADRRPRLRAVQASRQGSTAPR